jgi:Zn-dependent protease
MVFDRYQGQSRWDPQTMSLRLFDVFDIRVRLHVFAIILMVVELLNGLKLGSPGISGMLIALLFFSVLFHEFGHCFGCRRVGGFADDILMHPLGGLAFCQPPHRPWEHLVTVLAGPAVNVVICLLLFPILLMREPTAWNYLNPFSDVHAYAMGNLDLWLVLGFKVNYWLLLFNVLLPIYPFDGGRIVQVAMWYQMDYYRSTLYSCKIGIGAGIILGCFALYFQNLLLFFIFAAGAVDCWRMLRELESRGPGFDNEFGDFSQGYTSLERSQQQVKKASPGIRDRFLAWQRKRRAAAEAKMEAEVDRVLAKISEQGMGSLTARERRFLTDASKRRRRV